MPGLETIVVGGREVTGRWLPFSLRSGPKCLEPGFEDLDVAAPEGYCADPLMMDHGLPEDWSDRESIPPLNIEFPPF
jgi:hypothetical protein